jgi:hypothetical protein
VEERVAMAASDALDAVKAKMDEIDLKAEEEEAKEEGLDGDEGDGQAVKAEVVEEGGEKWEEDADAEDD